MRRIVNRAMAAIMSAAFVISGMSVDVMAKEQEYIMDAGSYASSEMRDNSEQDGAVDPGSSDKEEFATEVTGNGGDGENHTEAEEIQSDQDTKISAENEAGEDQRQERAEDAANEEGALPDTENEFESALDEESDAIIKGETEVDEETGDSEILDAQLEMELVSDVEGYRIIARGAMPEGAALIAKKVAYTQEYRDVVEGDYVPSVELEVAESGDERVESEENAESEAMTEGMEESWAGYEERVFSYTVYEAFDISVVVEDEVWQPVDDGEVIKISIEGIAIPEDANELEVTRISDEEMYTGKLEAEVEGDTVSFDTEHFTVFVIGSTTYDSNGATRSWDISAGQDGALMAYWYEDDNVLLISGSGDMKNSSGLDSMSVFGSLEGYRVVWDDKGITSIGNYMFALPGSKKDNTATFEELPSGLKRIGIRAFERCVNFDQAIPESVTEIGDYAFANCSSFKGVRLPEELENLGVGAFQQSGIESINIPSGIKTVPDNLCYRCNNLVSISFSDKTEKIGRMAFYGFGKETSGVDIDFSNCAALSEIAEYAFYGARPKTLNLSGTALKEIKRNNFDFSYELETVILPECLTSIGDKAFEGCIGLKSVNFKELTNLTRIGSRAFAQCWHLDDVNLMASTGLESIGAEAFKEDYSLTAIRLPASVNTIGDRAFNKCHVLETIEAYGNATLGENVFLDTDFAGRGLDPDNNYLLDGRYRSYKLPIKTNLTGDAAWFDTYDFKSDLRVVGGYTVRLPMSIDLVYDGDISGNATYVVDNDTNGWSVIVSCYQKGTTATSGVVRLSDGKAHNLVLSSDDITYSNDYKDHVGAHGAGESRKEITFKAQNEPMAEGVYRGTLTFRTGIRVGMD